LGYPLVQRRDRISRGVILKRIMENPYDRGVAAAKDPDDASAVAAVGPGGRQFNQHLIALHGAIHLVGRNEDVVVSASLARFRADESEAVAMHVQTAGEEVVAIGCLGSAQ